MMIDVKVHNVERIDHNLFPGIPGNDMFGVVATRGKYGDVSTFYYNSDDIRRHIEALEDLAREMDEHQKTEGVA